MELLRWSLLSWLALILRALTSQNQQLPATPRLAGQGLCCLSSVWSCASSMQLLWGWLVAEELNVWVTVLVLKTVWMCLRAHWMNKEERNQERSVLIGDWLFIRPVSGCLVLGCRLETSLASAVLSTKESTLRSRGVWVCLFFFQYLRNQMLKHLRIVKVSQAMAFKGWHHASVASVHRPC